VPDAAAVIETDDLTRGFRGVTAVDGLTLQVAAGEVVALLGPNGAGKTTTVRLLNGVLSPERGTSRVLGLDSSRDGHAIRARTGVVTETASLDDRLTAMENVLTHARIRGLSIDEARRRAMALFERFDMAGRADEQVQGFSTGQRKRVALARSLVHDPEVLFLDEPTSGLDPDATRDVTELIATLARERGRTVLLCTHFLAEAGRLCHRMAVLQRGRLLAFGRPDELAARLWRGTAVDLDLGRTADEHLLGWVGALEGVHGADASPTGAVIRITDRAVLPTIVASLVGRDITVYAVVPRPATMEDVYFAVTGGDIGGDIGDGSGDGLGGIGQVVP
jgi:ABC-2 type transport system ATP-binding protein